MPSFGSRCVESDLFPGVLRLSAERTRPSKIIRLLSYFIQSILFRVFFRIYRPRLHNLVLLENCVVVLSRSLNMFLFSIFKFFDATVIIQKKQEVF